MKTLTIKEAGKLLRKHFDSGGTLNDSETDRIYREANGISEGEETDLETVENWAVEHAAENPEGGAQ